MKILLKQAITLSGDKKDFLVEGAYIKKIGDDITEKCDREIDCKNRLIIPGLYNCHTHAAMTLFRGYGEDMPLDKWLTERIFPAEDLLTQKAVSDASFLACAEMIKNGIVSFTDMYFMCDKTADAVIESGMKANISRSLVSFDENADPLKDERFIESQRLFEKYHNTADGRIKIDMSIHAEYTNTERNCRALAEYAAKVGANMHVHLSETEKEHEECKARRGGKTPTEFFDMCGLFNTPTSAAHCVYVTESDMDIMKARGVSPIHNPVSNLKLGSGVMPLEKMAEKGLNVTIGTDGAASNNTLDVLKEMYTAAILHKGINRAPEKYCAGDFIKYATENGAISQGRCDSGELKEGKKADIVLIDLDSVNNIPMYDPKYALVYSANSNDVVLTMCDGKILYENGEYKTLDIEKIKYDMRCTCAGYFKKD